MKHVMKNTTKTKLWTAIWIIVGILLITFPFVLDYILDTICVCDHDNNIFVIIINSIFPSLATIAFFSGAWEVLSKKSLAEEVLELSDVADNYIDSGIEHVYKEFTEIEWKKLFKGSKRVVCFFAYAYSWRSENRSALNMLKEQKTNITIILPDYKNDDIINVLNHDFKYAEYALPDSEDATKDVKNFIMDAENFYKKFGANVKLYSGYIKSSYYLIDNKCIIAPFNHGHNKSDVPAILCKEGGTFFEFCIKDIDAIINEST